MAYKGFQWSLTLALFIAFVIMLSISINNLFKREIGTYQSIEYSSFLPDFTICPLTYDKSMSNISIYENIHIDGNHTALDLMMLPSMKQMINDIAISNISYNQQKSELAARNLWKNGKVDDGLEEEELWQEFYITDHNSKDSFEVFRCATLRWPNNMNFGSDSVIEFTFNMTYVDLMRIDFHERNNSKVLSKTDDSKRGNFMIKNYGGIYDLRMKKKKLLTSCTIDAPNRFDCIMTFIASKLKCAIELEKFYFPKNYPICKSHEDFKSYIDLRMKIYQGYYEEDLKICHERKCHQNSWNSNLQSQFVMDMSELWYGYSSADMAVFTFHMFEKEVAITEEYFIYGLTDFISDFGAYLGLFLGWSILSMINDVITKIKEFSSDKSAE